MAWRFKASKYKNAVPVAPKLENCVRDFTVCSYRTYAHNIAASAAFMAFNVGRTGSSLAVLPIDDCGRKGKDMPLLHGHTDTVTNMNFSPFHDDLLATGSQDCSVKIWHIPKNGLEANLTDPECVLYSKTQKRVEGVLFHPVADCLLSTTSFNVLDLWDLTTQQSIHSNTDDHTDMIQCINWSLTGDLVATTCKDQQLRILDCRKDKSVVCEVTNHQGIKDSRVVWLKDGNRLLTTGFNGARQREVFIRDIRKMSETERSFELDDSTGVLLPLYDPDTNMLLLAGKGDTYIIYMELSNQDHSVLIGLRYDGEDQTKGACLVPKRALSVMKGEVNRVLQLTTSMVVPIMYRVPRKTYRDFHADLFPDTTGCVSDLTPLNWLSGENTVIPKISLDPAKNEAKVLHRGSLQEIIAELNKKESSKTRSKTTEPDTDFQTKKEPPELADKIEEPFRASLKNLTPFRNGSSRGQNGTEDGVSGEADKGRGPEGESSTPRPKPRSSRSNSVDLYEDRPVAKPRTHKNSLDSSHSVILEVFKKADSEDDFTVTDRPQPCVIQSVNPLLPISGGYKPRLGPKPFTPPKLQSYSSVERPSAAEPNNLEKVSSVPQKSETKDARFAQKPSEELTGGDVETPYGDIRSPSEYEKLATYETEFNDFTKVPENSKIYEKNDLGKICNKTSELNLNYGNVCDKIENEIDKPLKKVPNYGESTNSGGDCSELRGEVPKTPSMAERRKLFESGRPDAEEKDNMEDALDSRDEEADLKSSIAERRRLYENRTTSMQDQGAGDKASPKPFRRKGSLKGREEAKEEPNRRSTLGGPIKSLDRKETLTPTPKRTSTVFGRVSKFRHLKGTPMHRSYFIENIRNVSRQVSGECDGFHANCDRVAVPLSGPGGKMAVFEVSKTGRLPDTVTPSLVHGTTVMDFCWDNFDNRRLAVACDDGVVRLWIIPENGLTESTNQPDQILESHIDKIYCIKFHPLAKDVLATASYDMTIKVWDLSTMEERLCLTGHSDQIFCMSWSLCGKFLATMCKDGLIRVYDPRQSSTPIKQGKGPVGTRGARLVWALDGNFIVVVGFDKVSERQIMVFKSDDLSQALTTVGLDVSPAILMPFYDEDSSTLFLTGRGDSTIYTFEVTEEPPYICPLSHHRCASLHQGLSFLNKSVCDVTTVEFARALRLSNNTIEPLSFTVPRIKSELFQDDLFPPTKVTWEPSMTSTEWFGGSNKQARRISLKPPNMESLSSVTTVEKNAVKSNSVTNVNIPPGSYKYNYEFQDQMKSKQEQIQKAVSRRMEINLSLEQDRMEGVDEHEWDE